MRLCLHTRTHAEAEFFQQQTVKKVPLSRLWLLLLASKSLRVAPASVAQYVTRCFPSSTPEQCVSMRLRCSEFLQCEQQPDPRAVRATPLCLRI